MKFKLATLASQYSLKSKMSNFHLHFVFVIILFVAGFNLGTCLECFHCSEFPSTSSGICVYPEQKTSPANIKSCNYGEVCIKHVTPSLADKPEKVIRNCGLPNYCETTAKLMERNLGASSEHCSTCEEMYCNSSASITTSFVIVVLSIALFFKVQLTSFYT